MVLSSLYEEVQAIDWERYAAVGGKALPFLVFSVSIFGFVLHRYIGVQIYVFLISFLIALLEVPVLFHLFPPCKRLHDQLVEDFGLGKGWIRGALYVMLSILCYVPKPSIALLAGLFLDAVAMLYVLSSAFSDGGVTEVKGFSAGPPSSPYKGAAAEAGFGTF